MAWLDVVRIRLVAVLLEASSGILVWRRPDATGRLSLWRRVALRLMVATSSRLMGIR